MPPGQQQQSNSAGGPFDYSSILSSSSGLLSDPNRPTSAGSNQQGSQYLSSILGSSNSLPGSASNAPSSLSGFGPSNNSSGNPLDTGNSSFRNMGNLGNIGGSVSNNMGGNLNLRCANSNNLPLNDLMNMPSFSSPSLGGLQPSGCPLAPGLASGTQGASSALGPGPGQGQAPPGGGLVGALGALDASSSTGQLSGPGGDSSNPNPGIDSDILPDGAFPSVSWLRLYNMHMYRWAGDSKEWTEYAMHLPREMISVVLGADHKAGLAEISHLSRCEVWLDEELLGGSKEKFVVFLRGSSGQPSNSAMGEAIELISDIMRRWVASNGGNATAAGSSDSPVKGSDLDTPATSLGSSVFDLSAAALGSGTGSSSQEASSLAMPLSIDSKFGRMKDRPELSKVTAVPGSAGYVQRSLEIPREVVGLIIGQSGKKIKELCQDSNAKIQFKVNKTAEREGRPGLLEVQGSPENVERGLQLIYELLQSAEKEKEKV